MLIGSIRSHSIASRVRAGTRLRLSGMALIFAFALLPAARAEAADTIVPSVPTGLTGSAVSCSQANLSWNASTDTGGSGLKGYNLYLWQNSAWNFLKLVTTPSTSLSGLTASTTYYYAVAAVDNAGNVSALTGWVVVSTPACTVSVPATPTGLAASAVSCGQINLTWNASAGASSYMVYVWQNSTWNPWRQVTTTSTSATGLAGSTTYYYAVAALNSAGTSALSGWVAATTPGCAGTSTTTTSSTTTTLASGTVPPTPTGLTATAASCSQINLRWNASTGATAYQPYIWQNSTWVPLTRVTTTSSAYTGLAASTTYYYEVAAINSAGSSAPSGWVTAVTPSCATSTTTTTVVTTTTTTTLGCGDTIAPTMPTGLGTTATSCSQIHLSWNASSDSSGIAPRYYVYRNNGTSPVATVSSLAYDDGGLAASSS